LRDKQQSANIPEKQTIRIAKKQMQLIAYLIRKSLKQFQMQWKIELKIETLLL